VTERRNKYEKKKEKKEFEIAYFELEAKLKAIKEKAEGPKLKTPFEQKKEAFERHLDGTIGLRGLARQKKAEAAEIYKNDPEALRDANDAIDEFLRHNA
jgi:hypothetical protein